LLLLEICLPTARRFFMLPRLPGLRSGAVGSFADSTPVALRPDLAAFAPYRDGGAGDVAAHPREDGIENGLAGASQRVGRGDDVAASTAHRTSHAQTVTERAGRRTLSELGNPCVRASCPPRCSCQFVTEDIMYCD
jgi:hypothetical protein